jgi:hypothetical protein
MPRLTATSSPVAHAILANIVVKPRAAGIAKVIADFVHNGDIDDSGTAQELTKKLSAARTYISQSDRQDASDILRGLVHELQAQSGKHIKPTAETVLMTDTKVLQSNL